MPGGNIRGRKRPQQGYGSSKRPQQSYGSGKKGKFEKIPNKEKQHLKEFGEAHPATLGESENVRYKKVKDEEVTPKFQKKREEPSSEEYSEEEEEEENPYKALIESLPVQDDDNFDDDDDDDDEDEEEEEDDDDDDDSDASSVDDDNVTIESSVAGKKKTNGVSANQHPGSTSDEEDDNGDDDINGDDISGDDIDDDDDVNNEDDEGSHSDTTDGTDSDKEQDFTQTDLHIDPQDEPGCVFLKEDDPFSQHFERDISQDLADKLLVTKPAWKKEDVKVAHVGESQLCSVPDCKQKEETTTVATSQETSQDLRSLHVKQSLCDRFTAVNKKICEKDSGDNSGNLTPFQQSAFSIVNQYKDLFFSDRNSSNAEQIRLVYCLHALNHVLKTRSRVMAHNGKIKNKSDTAKKQKTSKKQQQPQQPDSDDYRDQGLTRPKVLMVLPFRDSALKVVNILSDLLSLDQSFVTNRTRFMKEFSEEEANTTKGFKPEDFEETFNGNTDDHFRIGLGIAKKSLKLYTEFYASDIILASPLGLRTVIGAEGDAERDFDFLSSIEILIFDQLDVFLMQNWEHITHLLAHMHRQPKESHGVDFSRVRMWCINGWSKLYRQTLAFSSICTAEINSVYNQYCFNYSGKYFVNKAPTDGSICNVITSMSQKFYRIPVDNATRAVDTRFEFFLKKIVPRYTDEMMSQTLVFISSYFDFVRLRNQFKKNETSYMELCEYTPEKTISRSRYMFFHGKIQFLLFTQRFHFYRRYRLRGIRHLIFYDLPLYPHFYHEICNMTEDLKAKRTASRRTADDCQCSVLYTRLDWYRLCGVVGTARAAQMLQSDSDTHLYVTGDSKRAK